MPESLTKHKKGKKKKLNKKGLDNQFLSAVTIQDVADAEVIKGNKPPKSHKNLTRLASKEAKMCRDIPVNAEEEQNDSIEQPDEPDSQNDQNEIETRAEDSSQNVPNLPEEPKKALDIPLEIWILISDFLRPPDVKTFSLICRSTYYVVNTPYFWIRLYKRYHRNVEIPQHLKKHCLEREIGLKANVVRSLFFFYKPYASLLTAKKYNNIEKLVGLQCIAMWAKLTESKGVNNASNRSWLYSYKMSEVELGRKFRDREKEEPDVNYNPDAQCRIVQVVSPEYNSATCVMGLKLRKIRYEQNNNYIHLQFGPSHLPVNSDLEASNIYLSLCRPPAVYEWWHPSFYT